MSAWWPARLDAFVIEPLPRWALMFLGIIAAGALIVVVLRIRDDGLGEPQPAYWQLDPSVELEPDSRDVSVLVQERACSSGRSPEGRLDEIVEYEADVIRIDIAVRPYGGDQDCQGIPPTPVVVQLDEAVGDRRIVGERPIPG
jgi:hypothetical protein